MSAQQGYTIPPNQKEANLLDHSHYGTKDTGLVQNADVYFVGDRMKAPPRPRLMLVGKLGQKYSK